MDDDRIERLARQAGQAVRERANELAQDRSPAETIGRRSRTRRGVLVGIVGLLAVVGIVGVVARTPADAPFIDEPSPGVPGLSEASQSAEEAARDGVLEGVAALPFDRRVNLVPPTFSGGTTRIVADEGVWVVSRVVLPDDYSGDTMIGDRDGVYGRDFVHLPTYAEILLLDASETRILRAFPLTPSPAAGALAIDDDAVYCARAGDGAEPDSMLCRINRSSHSWTVRIFPHAERSAYTEPGAYIPDHWTIGDPLDLPLVGELVADQGLLRVVADGHVVAFDAETLELVESTDEPYGRQRPGLVPPTAVDGDEQVVTLRFPDGTAIQLRYPVGYDFTSRGVTASTAGTVPGFSRTIDATYGPRETVLENRDGELLDTYTDGRGGQVEFWRFSAHDEIDHLVFSFDQWTVFVYDYRDGAAGPHMSATSRQHWADSLTGVTDEHGFLLLDATPPLELMKDSHGPQLGLHGSSGAIGLLNWNCEPPAEQQRREGNRGDYLVWCDPATGIQISITADSQTLDALDGTVTITPTEQP